MLSVLEGYIGRKLGRVASDTCVSYKGIIIPERLPLFTIQPDLIVP